MGRRHATQARGTGSWYEDAVQSRDPAAFARTFSEGGLLDIKPLDHVVVGRESLQAAFTTLVEAFPDLKVTLVRRYLRGEEVVDELFCTGTHAGDFIGRAASGRTVTVRARVVYRLLPLGVERLDLYLDLPSLLPQLGEPNASGLAETNTLAAGLLAANLTGRATHVLGFQEPPVPAKEPRSRHRRPTPTRVLGYALALLVIVGAAAAFLLTRGGHQSRLTATSAPPPTVAPSAPSPSANASGSASASPTASVAPPPNIGTLTVNGVSLLGATPAQLARLAGSRVVATGIVVQQVARRDGLWLGPTPQSRIWMELTDEVSTNPVFNYQPGQHVSFVGVLIANTPAFDHDVRVDDNIPGYQQIITEGYHIDTNYLSIRVG